MSSSSPHDGDYYPQQAQSSQTAITAFLAKLWALVNDASCDDLIAWDPSGTSFHVFDQSRFAREILPRYFKHNNFASFIRQLNMYGFRKMSTIEHGSLKNERDDIEFAHPSFLRGHESLLEFIKRRAPDHHQQKVQVQPATKVESTIPSPAAAAAATTAAANMVSNDYPETKPSLSHLLEDVRSLQTKQTSLTDKLFHMEDENQALWREVGLLKQKHAKQQQIVSKLMEFLLHFLTTSTQTQRPSVEQASSTGSPQQAHSNPILNTTLAAHGLKRKQPAIMLGDRPTKRPNLQQPNHLSQPIRFTRQQPGIIINELTDNDTTGWLHTADTSPLVDLVPSPPPVPTASSSSTTTTNFPQQTNYDWMVPTDDLRSSINFPSQTKSNAETNSYIPDFFLTTDESEPTSKATMGQLDQSNLPGINTSLKEERLDLSNLNSQRPSLSIHPSGSGLFSINDVTDDVDHIQTSLDNIREFMFDNLPDGATIDDLFGDDPVLLSSLLPPSTDTTNLLADQPPAAKIEEQYLYPNQSSSCKQLMLHETKNPPQVQLDMDNQLLEQLINETTKIEEQQKTLNNKISSLASEKLHLAEPIYPQTTSNN